MTIEKLRKKANISQEELAKELGVTQGAISQWARGVAQPTADKLPKLAEVLGCTIDELYGKG